MALGGGRTTTTQGYVELWLDPSDPYFVMTNKDGYVLEHRLVMARHIGRFLQPDEEVHHRNKNKQDNSIRNLQLVSTSDHAFMHRDVDFLMRRVTELEAEVEQLQRLLHEQQAKTS